MPDALKTILRLLKRAALSILLSVLILGLFIATLIAIIIPLTSHDDVRLKRSVGRVVPSLFPYLIMTPGDGGPLIPRIVFHKDLKPFLEAHPEHEFLVPADDEARLRDEVSSWSASGRPVDPGGMRFDESSFEIERRSPGRQEIRLTASLDDDRPNTGWYEATAEAALPRYHKSYFGPGIILDAFGLGLVLNLGLWIAGYVAFRLYRRRRQA